MNKTFIYLIRRDKKDVKVITILEGTCQLQKINELSKLKLGPRLEKEVQSIINENKIQWEAWIESAESLLDFINSLRKRNIKVPYKYNPMIKISDLEKEGSKVSRKFKSR